jgi:hypothetical protein
MPTFQSSTARRSFTAQLIRHLAALAAVTPLFFFASQRNLPAAEPIIVSSGSGFFVTAEGHLVTNAHVVEGCQRVRSSHGGRINKVSIDERLDLALYIASEKPKAFARLRHGRGPRAGEPVVAVGFPLSGLLSSDPIVTTGIISAVSGLNNDRKTMQITAPVQPGNSGGPLLGENGSVVGVVVSKLNALKMAEKIGDIPQNVNFALGLWTLHAFLDTNGVPYTSDDSSTAKSPADIAAEAARYTVLLECVKNTEHPKSSYPNNRPSDAAFVCLALTHEGCTSYVLRHRDGSLAFRNSKNELWSLGIPNLKGQLEWFFPNYYFAGYVRESRTNVFDFFDRYGNFRLRAPPEHCPGGDCR